MNKTRLEAFSDGVFAIAITLLVLDIRLPDANYEHLLESLEKIIPNLLSYIMSFCLIGMYWIFHHQYSDLLKRVNLPFLFLNLLNLLCISFMPFPTALLSRFPFTTIPTFVYGLTLLVTNVVGFITVYYLSRHEELSDGAINPAYFKAQLPMYIFINLVYLIGLFVAYFEPKIGFSIFALVLILLILRIIKNQTLTHKKFKHK